MQQIKTMTKQVGDTANAHTSFTQAGQGAAEHSRALAPHGEDLNLPAPSERSWTESLHPDDLATATSQETRDTPLAMGSVNLNPRAAPQPPKCILGTPPPTALPLVLKSPSLSRVFPASSRLDKGKS